MTDRTVTHRFDAACPFCANLGLDDLKKAHADKLERQKSQRGRRERIPGTERVLNQRLEEGKEQVPAWVNVSLQPKHRQKLLTRPSPR